MRVVLKPPHREAIQLELRYRYLRSLSAHALQSLRVTRHVTPSTVLKPYTLKPYCIKYAAGTASAYVHKREILVFTGKG